MFPFVTLNKLSTQTVVRQEKSKLLLTDKIKYFLGNLTENDGNTDKGGASCQSTVKLMRRLILGALLFFVCLTHSAETLTVVT